MELPVNTFKRALKAGESQIGLWCSLSSNYAAEAVAGAGFDWLLLDTEHSPNDLVMVLSQLQAVTAYATHPVVRVPWNDMVTIKRFLDIGAQTLLIPYVQNEDEAKNAVAYTRYPPEGLRGMGGTTRATRFGRVKDYAKRAQEELCLLVQVETQTALDNLEKIAAVPGVDGVFIGPADLHASLGYAGETANPNVKPLIDEGIRRIRKAGKAPGILTGVEADARHWLELGCQFVAVGTDAVILAREADKLAAKFHERIANASPAGRSDQEDERIANASPAGRSDQEDERIANASPAGRSDQEHERIANASPAGRSHQEKEQAK